MAGKKRQNVEKQVAARLKEAELLLRMHHAGILGAPKRKPRKKTGRTRVAVLIDGDDVTVIRPAGPRGRRTPGSYDQYAYYGGYDQYAYYDGYDQYAYYGGYDQYAYYDGYDQYAYYGGYDQYAYYGAYDECGNFPRYRSRKGETLTVTIQLRSDGSVRIEKGTRAEKSARRKSRGFF